MTSLFQLVRDARSRHATHKLNTDLAFEVLASDYRLTFALNALDALADEVVQQADLGNYPMACRLASVFADHAELADEPPDDEPFDYAGRPELFDQLQLSCLVPRDLFCLAYAPPWIAFVWACELAVRIDSFLATLECRSASASIARWCRQDLLGLLILADWCEEASLPQTAVEARHLYKLVGLELP